MASWVILIGNIINEGLKAWNEKRRTRFLDQYKDIIDEISKAENSSGSKYSDAALDLLDEELKNFLSAYQSELKKHNEEKGL